MKSMREIDDRQFEYLDEAERDLIESVENDEWKPVEDVDEAKKQARRQAMATLHRDERCNLQERTLEWCNRDASSDSACISHTEDIDSDALDALVADIKKMFGVDTTTHRIMLRSLEPPSWLQVVAEAPWWFQALGAGAAIYVAELLKGAAKSTVRAISKRDDALSALASSLCEFRKKHPIRTKLMIGLPVLDEESGTLLTIRADAFDDVEHEIALFVHHLPELIELMESEELSKKAVGMVQLMLVGEGNIEVRWTDHSTFEERRKILRLRST